MRFLDRIRALLAAPDCPAIYVADGMEGALLTALKQVIDPEVGLDIVTMGLIRDVSIRNSHGYLTLTLTTAGCPMADQLLAEISRVISEHGLTPALDVVFEPPWRPEHIAPEGQAALG